MNQDKRFLLAMGLTVTFLYVWFEFFVPKPVPKKPVEQKASVEATKAQEAPAPKAEAKPLTLASAPEETKTVQSDLWTMTVSNKPGTIQTLDLTQYHENIRDPQSHIRVVPIGAATAAVPMVWEYQLDGVSVSEQNVAYAMTDSSKGQVVFEGQLSPTLKIKKTGDIDPKSYASTWTVEITNTGASSVLLGAKTSLEGKPEAKAKGGFFSPRQEPLRATSYINDEAHYWTLENIHKSAKIPAGDIQWAGLSSQYFLLAAIPDHGRWESLNLSSPSQENIRLTMAYPAWTLEPSKSLRYRLKLYAGPKDIAALSPVSPTLDRAIDLGNWLGVLARPMLQFLRWAYRQIPNYGVAIILLTILVRLLLTPLTHMQTRSMKKMQEHKPYMDELKERFKDNKEAYSRELMSYMRQHKINPMGGCLLLLPQLPIFFALYRVLQNSIELRHEPLGWWIRDLSAHDPYFVLPALLGVAMFFQQKLTPTPSADEAQQMMMKVMPVMFTVLMLFLPAGLNLYILVSTLWGVVQQYKIQHTRPAIEPIKKASGS